VFALLQPAVDLVMDCSRPELRSPYLARLLKESRAASPSVDVVCVGSSRFALGVVPSQVEMGLGRPVHNASIPAADFSVNDFILKRLLRDGFRPRVVVVEVTPEMVARRNRWLGAHILLPPTWTDVPGYARDVWQSGNAWRLVKERVAPVCRYHAELRDALSVGTEARPPDLPPAQIPATAAATGPLPQPVAPPREQFLDGDRSLPAEALTREGLPRFRDWLSNYQVAGTAPRSLERLLGRCRRHDIAVLLVAPPLTRAHRQLYTPDIEAAFRSYLRGLEARGLCRFLDCRDTLPDDLFLDNHHVNAEGAVRFSRRLGELIRDRVRPGA
jgi:hypothetical protein